MRINCFVTLVALALGIALPASTEAASDPAPTTLSVRRQAAWEACPASPTVSTGQKCPTLVVDFGAAIVEPLLGRITGAKAIATNVWAVSSLDISTRTATTHQVVEAKTIPTLTGLVLLVLDPATSAEHLDLKTHALVMTFYDSNPPVTISTTATEPEEVGGRLVDAEDPDDADVYFAGRAKGARGKAGVFSLEARLRREWTKGNNEWGGIVEVTAEEQGDIDPDSITGGLSFARMLSNRQRAVRFAAMLVGGEFSRDDPRTKGFLSSGQTTWTVVPTVGGRFAVDLLAGYEVGHNFANAISAKGSGLVARATVGVDSYLRWDKRLGFNRITVTGSVLMRLLGRAEIDPDRPDGSDNPTLTKRTRHRAELDLNFGVNERFGLAIQIRSGPLPPAFEHVNRSIAASLVYKADWR